MDHNVAVIDRRIWTVKQGYEVVRGFRVIKGNSIPPTGPPQAVLKKTPAPPAAAGTGVSWSLHDCGGHADHVGRIEPFDVRNHGAGNRLPVFTGSQEI